MKKALLNYILDISLLLVLLSQIFTGILLHRFPPETTDKIILGLTRYTWGTLHWTASILFMIIIVLHIVLHWEWIANLTRKRLNKASILLFCLLAGCCIAAFLIPYYLTRDLPKRSQYSGPYQETTYNESIRLQQELGCVSSEPHLLSGPWRLSPTPAE